MTVDKIVAFFMNIFISFLQYISALLICIQCCQCILFFLLINNKCDIENIYLNTIIVSILVLVGCGHISSFCFSLSFFLVNEVWRVGHLLAQFTVNFCSYKMIEYQNHYMCNVYIHYIQSDFCMDILCHYIAHSGFLWLSIIFYFRFSILIIELMLLLLLLLLLLLQSTFMTSI